LQALKEQGEFFEKKAKEEAKTESKLQCYSLLFITKFHSCLSQDVFSKNIRCGRSNALPFDKIVGGAETDVGEFPWQAGLIISESKDYFRCAGSLISSEWVLTAAHCVEGSVQSN
jgi:secreted trypsin-like serine protease